MISIVGDRKAVVERHHQRRTEELATLIEETFGVEPFTFRQMNDALNPLTQESHSSGSLEQRRYSRTHLGRLGEDGRLEFNPRTGRYELNIIKTYAPQLPDPEQDEAYTSCPSP